MATITENRTRPANLSESSRKVRDPLQRLRLFIRTYVITEALTVLVICLAVFFWVGLALDYGFFKLFGIDWVKDLPRWVRAALIATGLVGVGLVVEIGKSLRLKPDHNPATDAPVGSWLARNPWALVVAFGLFVALFYAGYVLLALLRDGDSISSLVVGLVFAGVLLLFTAAIVVKRLLYEFRDQALALVLEKRFGKLLGDRLITAVELNDPKIAAKYGYSSAMVEQTIHEAAQRVDQLNLREVFDWKRLYLLGFLALALTAGMFGLTLGGMFSAGALRSIRPSDRVVVAEGDLADLRGTVLKVSEETVKDESGEETQETMVVLGNLQGGPENLTHKLPARLVKRDLPLGRLLTELDDAARIWGERNILLDNERWPTRSLVALVNFPASGELKIGKGLDGKDARVDLVALAVEYAVRDPNVPQCWRAATLADLSAIGVKAVVSADLLPKTWAPRDPERGWTVDELKLLTARTPETDPSLPGLVRTALKTMFDEVDEKALETSMSRTLRKLVVPAEVTVEYRTEDGRKKSSEPMTTRGGNEYGVTLDGLNQSIDFYLSAEDYRGDNYRITLVPPPRVAKMLSYEAHPAYLYHLAQRRDRDLMQDPIATSVPVSTAALLAAPAGTGVLTAVSALYPERPYDDDKFYLGPRKQQRKGTAIDVIGSIKPKIEVPVGSDVRLVAETDKDLAGGADSVRLEDKGSSVLRGRKPVVTGPRNFELVIPNVRSSLDFRLEFVDTDGAPGFQEMLIEPRADESPDVRQFKPEVVRQVNNKYLITPTAVVPFSFDIKDNEGISAIDFVYSISEAPSQGEANRRAARAAAGVGLVLGGPEAPLTSLVYLRALPVTLEDRRERIEGRLPLAHFQNLFNEQRRPLEWKAILEALDQPLALERRMIRTYIAKELRDLDPYLEDHEKSIDDVKFFKGMNVAQIQRDDAGIKVPLKAREWEIQKQYEMELRLEVRDTNLERPGRGVKSAPAGVPLQFSIVSEVEMLYEIGQEEQRLYDELFKSYADLKKAQEQMQGIRFDLPPAPVTGKPISFESFSVRVEEIEKALNEGKRILTKVHGDYDRILRELRTNRIQNRDYLSKVKDEIVSPLRQLRDGDLQIVDREGNKVRCGFPPTQGEASKLRKTIDNAGLPEARRLDDAKYYAETTEKELEHTLRALGDVLAQMRGLVGLNEILKRLVGLEQKEREFMQKLEAERKRQEDDLFKGLLDPKK